MELKDEKETMAEDERDRKEEVKARLDDLHEAMGPRGFWADSLRRPTKSQVKSCIEELDRTKQRWEDDLCSDLFDLLLERFPELRK